MERIGSIRKRKDVLATLFTILVCIIAIFATTLVVVVKRQDSSSEPAEVGGSLPQNKNEAFAEERLSVGAAAPSPVATESSQSAPPPTAAPTERPDPKEIWQATTFYVIADVPYNEDERQDMPGLVAEIPGSGEHVGTFAVHLGDIKHAQESCDQSAIDTFVGFVKESSLPMFVVVGDNEYNDCSNPEEALELWREGLVRFDTKHWNHDLPVKSMDNRPESFFFVNKGTLFIGLNLVGTPSFNDDEWDNRLSTQVDWTIQLIDEHRTGDNEVGAIVIFAHASPNGEHNGYFDPLRRYIRDVLQNSLPILYLCGDVHSYFREPNYRDQPSWLRVRSEGGSKDPPLKVVVDPLASTGYEDISQVFNVTRYWLESRR
jgi:hypothetical protein